MVVAGPKTSRGTKGNPKKPPPPPGKPVPGQLGRALEPRVGAGRACTRRRFSFAILVWGGGRARIPRQSGGKSPHLLAAGRRGAIFSGPPGKTALKKNDFTFQGGRRKPPGHRLTGPLWPAPPAVGAWGRLASFVGAAGPPKPNLGGDILSDPTLEKKEKKPEKFSRRSFEPRIRDLWG